MDKVKIGIVGVGNISGIYLKNLTNVFSGVEIAAVTDFFPERAEAAAKEYGIPKVCATADELIALPEIEIVLNLTTPKQHHDVAKKALLAGKNTHSEKPMSVNLADAKELLDLSREKKLLIGVAPDTFLGAGIQTCRKLLDDGYIGRPIGATAFMTCHGHESWHPDPEFYYEQGGGPMLDMGPYYLTALVNLLGPVKRLSGMSRASFETRTITSQKKYGKIVPVEVPTHVAGLLDFDCGAIGTILTSFDVWKAQHPCIEIFGSEGTMWVPDPNGFGGPVKICRRGGDIFEIPLQFNYADNSRGVGVADMAAALREGRPNRASGELAYHVLEIMLGCIAGEQKTLESTCARPAPMNASAIPGTV